MLEQALYLASMGLYVFPCKPGDKRPATRNGFKDSTTDEAQIREWWRQNPDYNIGVETGKPSGIIVIDVDGEEGMEELIKRSWLIEEAPTVETGGGGRHIYAGHPGGYVQCQQRIAPGIDIKGDGGYVIAPGSVHSSGRCYEWILPLDETELPELPEWATKVQENPKQNKDVGAPQKGPATSLIGEGGKIPEGERNCTLFRLASSMRARGGEYGDILANLQVANEGRCVLPLGGEELQKIARSACRYERGRAAPPPAVFQKLHALRVTIEQEAWPGMAGPTDRDVLLALIGEAELHGHEHPEGVSVSISTRALSLLARVSHKTVWKSLKRLDTKRGLVKRISRGGGGGKSGSLLLAARGGSEVDTQPLLPSLSLVTTVIPPFRWGSGSLGKGTREMVECLAEAPATTANIAAHLGKKDKRSVRRKLRDAEARELVVRGEDGRWQLAPNFESALDREFEADGTHSRDRLQRREYEQQREAYRRYRNLPDEGPVGQEPPSVVYDADEEPRSGPTMPSGELESSSDSSPPWDPAEMIA